MLKCVCMDFASSIQFFLQTSLKMNCYFCELQHFMNFKQTFERYKKNLLYPDNYFLCKFVSKLNFRQ